MAGAYAVVFSNKGATWNYCKTEGGLAQSAEGLKANKKPGGGMAGSGLVLFDRSATLVRGVDFYRLFTSPCSHAACALPLR